MFNDTIFAKRMGRLGTESAFEVLSRAKALEAQGRSIIHLEIGQPDFFAPRHIQEGAAQAIRDGFTKYTDSQGIREVREGLAEYCRVYKHVNVGPEEIVVVPGGKPIIFYTMLALIDQGDEVIYPNPGFPVYESCINFAGGKPVPLPILQKNDFRIDPEELKALITPKTRLIVLNNPANPTGGLLRQEDIQQIAEILEGTNAYILSDEIYSRLVFDHSPVTSIASLPGMKERTIILESFSKTYAMPGWRLGYGVANKNLIAQINRLMINSNSCTSAFVQMSALSAIQGDQEAVVMMCDQYQARSRYLTDALNSIPGVACKMPEGAFYLFPDISGLGLKSKAFADRLLLEGGVAALSGTDFGTYGEGHIRFSVAASMEDLQEGFRRFAAFVAGL